MMRQDSLAGEGFVAAVLWLSVVVGFTAMGGPVTGHPDAAMHAARFAGLNTPFDGGFFPRGNVPHGFTLHWTAPFDLVVWALSFAFDPILGSRASDFALRIFSPVCLASAGAWAFVGLRGHLSFKARLIATLCATTAPAVVNYSLGGRADQHALALALAVMFAVTALRGFASCRLATAFVAGAIGAFATWTSPEGFMAVACCSAALVAGRCLLVEHPPKNAALFDGVLFTAMGAISAVALVADPPQAGLTEPVLDRHSILYAAFPWFAAACALLADWLRPRGVPPAKALAATSCLGAVAAVLWASINPAILNGPMSEVTSPAVREWLGGVTEMRAVWDAGSVGTGIAAGMVVVAVALGYLVRHDVANRRVWLLFAGLLAVFAVVGATHLRGAYYFQAFGAVPIGAALARFLDLPRLRLVTLAMSVGLAPTLAYAHAGASNIHDIAFGETASDRTACERPEVPKAIAPMLRADESGHLDVLTHMTYAPAALTTSPRVRVVAGPYHRNAAGIATVRELRTPNSAEALRKTIRQRGIDAVLVCRTRAERLPETSGFASILRNPPEWLEPRALPEQNSEFALFAVRPGS